MRNSPEHKHGSSPSCEFIYQAGVSFLITGQNFRFWTAYMFLDDYDESEEGEVLEDYDASNRALEEEARITLDPFTGIPIAWQLMKPRQYFLKVLEVRSGRVWREWRYTVTHILSYFGDTVGFVFSGVYSTRADHILREMRIFNVSTNLDKEGGPDENLTSTGQTP